MAKYKNILLDATVALTKALADEQRLRILMSLRGRELCACQITELLALAPSTISKHLAILRQAGLVQLRKDGRWYWYRLPAEDPPPDVAAALQWCQSALANCARIRDDRQTLKAILKQDPEALCRKQCDKC